MMKSFTGETENAQKDLTIIQNNLTIIQGDENQCQKRKLLHLDDLAFWIINQYSVRNTAKELPILLDDHFRQLYEEATSLLSSEDIFAKISLCHHLSHLLKKQELCDFKPESITVYDKDCGENAFIYMKNNYSDDAYRIFNEKIGKNKVSYCPDFLTVCENVSSGTVRYGILPISSSRDGVLNRPYVLIDSYGLMITSLCTVFSPDSDYSSDFVLVQKNAEYPLDGTPLWINISVNLSADILAQICSVAQKTGLSLVRVRSLTPFSEKSELIFYTSQGDFSAFFCYLQLEIKRFTLLGIYTNHNEGRI